MKNLFNNINYNSRLLRILLHLLFWIAVLVFYYILFSLNSESREVSFILSTGLMPVAIGATYFFNYVLVPKYLMGKRYFHFFLFSFYTLLTTTWLSLLIVFFTLIYILSRDAYINQSVLHPQWQVITLNIVVLFAIAARQVKRSLLIQQEKSTLEKRHLTTQLKLKEAELKLLKAQIHPHFLFNTLNNLYGLTLEKSDEAPQLVLRLSEILDYILYRCNEPKVLLTEEINTLKNYLEIERIRYSGKVKISQQFPDKAGNLKIAPLLFVPLFENAFKHGVSQAIENAYVKVKLSLIKNKLVCRIENSKSQTTDTGSMESGGIGLQNVKKRLELVYPGNYVFNINSDSNLFLVNLELELEE